MENTFIQKTIEYVKKTLSTDASGHDFFHTQRVWNLSRYIAQKEEKGDLLVIELGALLHDIADWKFHDGDDLIGSKVARKWLEEHNVDEDVVVHVCDIVKTISYKGTGVPTPMKTIEGQIVQDADRLDALGAIGIARAFAYGGHAERCMYDPEMLPSVHVSAEEYKKSNGTTINHFYEKLLLLKNRMNTVTGKKMADARHAYMKHFLEQFYLEWNGKE